MSHKGQTRRFRHVRATSALPPIATINRTCRQVGSVPATDSCAAAKCIWTASDRLRPSRNERAASSSVAALPHLIAQPPKAISFASVSCDYGRWAFAPNKPEVQTDLHDVLSIADRQAEWPRIQ